MRSTVVLLRCESYEDAVVAPAVRKGIDLLGGPGMFAKPGEKILIKPNWLAPDPPEKCTCTHPAVFKAVCETLQSVGAILTYGDSPAFHKPEIVATKSGFSGIARQLSVTLADFHGGAEVFYKKGIQNKKFVIANGVLESDAVVSLPKLKSHGFQRFTGAVKNQFGCIPGALKREFHVKTPNPSDFAKMLCDLNGCISPRLYIMDAVMAMEGNGPRGGTPKKLKVLLFSTDPVALDATACRIIGLDPHMVPTITAGFEAGAGIYKEESIEILGDAPAEFIDRSFDVKRESIRPVRRKGLLTFVKNALVPRPVIVQKKCIKCGVCVGVCPVNPKALYWPGGNKNLSPAYHYKQCIRCLCCQELCPQGAVIVKAPLLRKIFMKPRTRRITQ